MKHVREIKKIARQRVTEKYWPAVGILLLAVLILVGLRYIPVLSWLLYIFVGSIVLVGIHAVSVHLYRSEMLDVADLFNPFMRYGRVLGGALWYFLWIFLWMLIWIVPYMMFISLAMVFSIIGMEYMNVGFLLAAILSCMLMIPYIIKMYSYWCTAYILAVCPNVPATKALDLSKKMMEGNKMRVFGAQLSFIGWILLSVITLGILWVFYVGPYYVTTMAGLFDEIKQNAIKRGVVTEEDFNVDPYATAARIES